MSAPERSPQSPIEIANPDVAVLIESRDALVQSAREISRSQIELWRQIPWLALIAHGRAGDFNKYQEAFKNGYWILESAPDKMVHQVTTGVVVDLETGELIDEASTYNFHDDECQPIPAKASGILKVLAVPEQLDAQTVIEKLKENGEKPPIYFQSNDGEDINDFVENIRKSYGVKPLYTRVRKQ